MKVYTEEEVVKLLDKYTVLTKIGAEFYLNKMNPIELPSDEDIWKWAEMQSLGEPTGAEEFGRIYGAKWMRDKIQGGDK